MHAFRNILLVITHAHTTDIELHQVFRLATDNRAKLHVMLFDNSLDVMQKFHFIPMEKQLEAMLVEQLEEQLNRIAVMAWEKGLSIEAQVIPGRIRDSILKVIDKWNFDLVVKLAEPRGDFRRKWLAEDDLFLLRNCPIPALIITNRGQMPSFSGRIMIAINVNSYSEEIIELNRRIIQYGIYIATQGNAELHCISVWDYFLEKHALKTLSDEERYELQKMAHSNFLCRQINLLSEFDIGNKSKNEQYIHLLQGQASDEIQRKIRELEIDLIIMGIVKEHSENVMIGSTSDNFFNDIDCSILSIHS